MVQDCSSSCVLYLSEPVPVRKVENPYAVQRPHASADMLERQGSFRGFTRLADSSPFKRNISLRLNELPSTLERQRQLSSGIIGPQQYGSGVAGPAAANTSGRTGQLMIWYLITLHNNFLRWPKKITARTTMVRTTTNKLHNFIRI